MSQVRGLNSDHQDRDRSCDERRVGVRASRTSSSSPLRIGLSRRSGDQKDSFVRHILSFALGHHRRHRPRSATPGPACRGTGTLPARIKRHRAAHLHPLACPAHLHPSQQEPSSHHLSFPLPPSQALGGIVDSLSSARFFLACGLFWELWGPKGSPMRRMSRCI